MSKLIIRDELCSPKKCSILFTNLANPSFREILCKLGDYPQSTIEIGNKCKISVPHTYKLLKEMYQLGLVQTIFNIDRTGKKSRLYRKNNFKIIIT